MGDFFNRSIFNYSEGTVGFKHKINLLLIGLILLSNLIITINIFKKFAYIIPEFFIICLTILLFNAQYCLCDPEVENKMLAFNGHNDAVIISLCKLLDLTPVSPKDLSINEFCQELKRILHFDNIFANIAQDFIELWRDYNYHMNLDTEEGWLAAMEEQNEFNKVFNILHRYMAPYMVALRSGMM